MSLFQNWFVSQGFYSSIVKFTDNECHKKEFAETQSRKFEYCEHCIMFLSSELFAGYYIGRKWNIILRSSNKNVHLLSSA